MSPEGFDACSISSKWHVGGRVCIVTVKANGDCRLSQLYAVSLVHDPLPHVSTLGAQGLTYTFIHLAVLGLQVIELDLTPHFHHPTLPSAWL